MTKSRIPTITTLTSRSFSFLKPRKSRSTKVARQSHVGKTSSFSRRGPSFNFLKIKQNLRSWGFRKNLYVKSQYRLPLTKRPNSIPLSRVRSFYSIPGFLKTSNAFVTTPLKGNALSFFFRFQATCPRTLISPDGLSPLTPYRLSVRSHFSVNQHWLGVSTRPFNSNSQNLNLLAPSFTPTINSSYQIHRGNGLKQNLHVSECLNVSTVCRTPVLQWALLLPLLQEPLLKSLFLQEVYSSRQRFSLPERQHFYAYSNRKIYRRSLRRINLFNKSVNRKFRTFATHVIKPHLHDNLVWGEVIPELPLALRGSFSSNKSSFVKVSVPHLHSFPSKSITDGIGVNSLVRKLSTGLQITAHQSILPQLTVPTHNTKRLLVNLTSRLRKLAPRTLTLKLKATAAKRVHNKTSLFLIRRLKRRFRRMRFSRRNAKVLMSPSSRQLTPHFKLWLKSNLTSLRHGNYITRRRKFTANQLLTRKISQALKGTRKTFLPKSKTSWTTPFVTSHFLGISSSTNQFIQTPVKFLTNSPTFFKPTISLFLTAHVNFWTNPVLLKYYLWRTSTMQLAPSLRSIPNLRELTSWVKRAQHSLSTLSFENQLSNIRSSNLWVCSSSHLTIRKTLLRLSSFTPFHGQVSLWYYKTLILFMENVTGRKVFLNFGAFIEDALTFEDKALCSIWAPRVLGFQRMLGHRIFLKESMVVIATAIRLKDPTFLANWIRAMLYRMSFWKYRLLFRYLRFVLRHLINYSFAHFQIRGIKLQLKGKISVAGNARTRTLVQRVGDTSHSKMSNRVAYDLSFVNSFTGVMGFKLWFFY